MECAGQFVRVGALSDNLYDLLLIYCSYIFASYIGTK